MKPFNLKEYLKDPSRKVVTRDGEPVRIVCTNARGSFPVVALIYNETEKSDHAHRFKEDGSFTEGCTNHRDLFFVTQKHEGWVNLYYNVCGTVSTDTTVFPTKEFAQASRKYQHYIDTVPVEWEE